MGTMGGNTTTLSAAGLPGLPQIGPWLPLGMGTEALGSLSPTLALPQVSQRSQHHQGSLTQVSWAQQERRDRDREDGSGTGDCRAA